MSTVRSKDGTTIAFDVLGEGKGLILVASALADRRDTKRLAALLAPHFMVINYDRRGRGASGDTGPYAVDREVEDIDALIDYAGGSALVFGSSSGAALALEAAAHGLNISRLALFEPPFVVDEADPRPPAEFATHLAELLCLDRRSAAVRYFMRHGIGMPAIMVNLMRVMPGVWSGLKAMAPTMLYDIAIVGDKVTGKPLQPTQWEAVTMPTLVLDGGRSPASLRRAARAVAAALTNAQLRTVDGQGHSAVVMAPKRIAPILISFFNP